MKTKVDWTRERLALKLALEAAWCFLLTAVVVIAGVVAICYFVDWLLGSAQ